MKKFLTSFAVLLVLLCGAGSAFSAEYAEGQVLVVLDVSQSAMGVAASNMAVFANSLSLQANSFATSVGAEAVGTYSSIARSSGKNIIHLRSNSKTTEQLMNELKNDPRVIGVQPNYIRRLNVQAIPHALPNDPSFGQLWGMTRIGADQVWNAGETGSKDVVVAVIDTGIDYNHADIAANMVTDSFTKHGRRFYNGNTTPTSDDNPLDNHGHGTHVAGTIGAVGNNNIGVVGVNWNVGLLAVKVLDANGSGSDADVIGGINYVVGENNAGVLAGKIKVANMSLGGWQNSANNAFGTAIESMSTAGIIVVISAGNESQNIANPVAPFVGLRPYPAVFSYDHTITVGATDNTDAKSNFSNYSPTYVHIAAPGSNIFSTVPNDGYGGMNGTSMAAPHVAGAAALLFSKYPGETATQIKARLLNNADKVGDTLWGHGRLNVKAAYDGFVTPVTSVTVTPKSASVAVGSTAKLTAAVAPLAAPWGVTWSSSDPTIATVWSDGGVTGIKAGTVTITATSIGKDVGNASKTDTCTVTVTSTIVPVTAVSVDPAVKSVAINGTVQLTAGVQPSNATTKTVTWISSNTDRATVSSTGLVTGKSAGSATITVSTDDGGKKATCEVTVTPAVLVTGVTLNKTTTSIAAGGTETLTATVAPADATNKAVTWSSNSTNATVGATTGVVTAVAGGSATITATTTDGSKTATCVVTITSTVRATGVSLSPTTLSLIGSQSSKLTATFAPANVTNKKVTWASNNLTVAEVNQDGVVKGKNIVGNAIITVTTADGGFSAQCAVDVKAEVIEPVKPVIPGAPVDVNPAPPAKETDTADAADKMKNSDLEAIDLEVVNGAVRIKADIVQDIGEKIGKTKASFDTTYELPVFTATVPAGEVVAVGYQMKGKALLAETPERVQVLKIFGTTSGDMFVYQNDPAKFGDKVFTVQNKKDEIVAPGAKIDTGQEYKLILFIRDGGNFDLDGEINGTVVDPTSILGSIAVDTPEPEPDPKKGGSSGGCTAAPIAVFALLLAVPLLLARKRK